MRPYANKIGGHIRAIIAKVVNIIPNPTRYKIDLIQNISLYRTLNIV